MNDDPIALRAQNKLLADLALEQNERLVELRRYAEECRSRAGAQLDALTVAARLAGILWGARTACPACEARRAEERRTAEMILGLANLQRRPV